MKPIAPALLFALAACSNPAEPGTAASETPGEAAPVASNAVAATGAPRTSQYTSLKSCRVVEQGKDEDWSTSRCDGIGGWALQLDYSDARDDLSLLRGAGEAKALDLTTLGNGGFNSLGETVEWRGQGGPGDFAPRALIVRNKIVENPEMPKKVTEVLVIVDLAQGCVTAQVPPQPGQNEAAREIADAPPLACLKR